MVTSEYSIGSAPSLLSMVRVTSARPRAGLPAVPAKTTSSIFPPRSGLTPCSPLPQENASTTLDLPEPFGPTMQVIPGSNRIEVADANDLNPRRVRVFRYTCRLLPSRWPHGRDRRYAGPPPSLAHYPEAAVTSRSQPLDSSSLRGVRCSTDLAREAAVPSRGT